MPPAFTPATLKSYDVPGDNPVTVIDVADDAVWENDDHVVVPIRRYCTV